MITKVCPTCGTSFESAPARNRIYCSRKCSTIAITPNRRKQTISVCEFCNKTFKDKTCRNRRYCSLACAGKACHNKSSNWQIANCQYCGTEFTRYSTNKVRFCSRECSSSWLSVARKGENNPSYKTGRRLCNRGPNWRRSRNAALKRDGYQCQLCGQKRKKGQTRVLSVHHIRPYRLFNTYEEANRLVNLITLCRKCHNRVERGDTACPQPLF